MKFIATILMMSFGFCSFAQIQSYLEGIVKDESTDEPIPFATVAIYQNGILKMGSETDLEGYFMVNKLDAGTYVVEFSSTGFQPRKIDGVVLVTGKRLKLDVELQAARNQCCCGRCISIYRYVPQAYKPFDLTSGTTFSSSDLRRMPFR